MEARSNPQATGGADVQLIGLKKRWGDVVGVDEVDLHIEAGEFLTLLGPSGSGKTTTLMMLAGFEMPDDGSVMVDGEDLTKKPAHKRNIGMVFQSYALFPHMSVFKNVAYPLKMRKYDSKAVREAVRDALEMVELAGLDDRLPRQLSGGQQQRVALARALVFRPPLLLMDEPLGALDKKLREHMQVEIKQIQQELGVTVVYVTHDQDEALRMSDRIALMNNGRFEQVGTPLGLYDRPANQFVADFIGQSNFFSGRLVQTEEGPAFVTSHGLRVMVSGTNGIKPENDAVLAVRPQRVVCDPCGDNCFACTVESLLYMGDYTKYFVATEGGDRILLQIPNCSGQPTYGVGERVTVGWEKDDARVVQ